MILLEPLPLKMRSREEEWPREFTERSRGRRSPPPRPTSSRPCRASQLAPLSYAARRVERSLLLSPDLKGPSERSHPSQLKNARLVRISTWSVTDTGCADCAAGDAPRWSSPGRARPSARQPPRSPRLSPLLRCSLARARMTRARAEQQSTRPSFPRRRRPRIRSAVRRRCLTPILTPTLPRPRRPPDGSHSGRPDSHRTSSRTCSRSSTCSPPCSSHSRSRWSYSRRAWRRRRGRPSSSPGPSSGGDPTRSRS